MTSLTPGAASEPDSRPFSHYVAFTLKEDTPENRAELIKGCTEFLEAFEGERAYMVAEAASEMDRDVSVKDFQVALHVMFDNKAAWKIYADAPEHIAFIEKYSHLWGQVRVFDSYIASHGATASK